MSVVVATYGDRSWRDLAEARAVPSARALGVPVVPVHGESLHEARNAGLAAVMTRWVVFLDADDELEPGYLEAMGQVGGSLRAPSVRYVRRGRAGRPVLPRVAGHFHLCAPECLLEGNWLVVGSAVETDLVRRVGGWRDFPWSEDWDLWLRCYLAGADIQWAPTAVYRAWWRTDSRNRSLPAAERNRVHAEILTANGVSR